MNFIAFVFGFIGFVLIAGMIVFVGSTQSLAVVDDNGAAGTAAQNLTDAIVGNVTSVGGASAGYLALLIVCLAFIAANMILVAYSRT